jgi:hypothetical protein
MKVRKMGDHVGMVLMTVMVKMVKFLDGEMLKYYT